MRTAPSITPPDPRQIGFASVEEAARYLALSRMTIAKMLASGQVPFRRYGRAIRIPWSWLLEQTNVGTSA